MVSQALLRADQPGTEPAVTSRRHSPGEEPDMKNHRYLLMLVALLMLGAGCSSDSESPLAPAVAVPMGGPGLEFSDPSHRPRWRVRRQRRSPPRYPGRGSQRPDDDRDRVASGRLRRSHAEWPAVRGSGFSHVQLGPGSRPTSPRGRVVRSGRRMGRDSEPRVRGSPGCASDALLDLPHRRLRIAC